MSKSTKEYTVIQSTSGYTLQEQVNCLLQDGWDCQGGISYTIDSTMANYMQAMVRQIKDNKG